MIKINGSEIETIIANKSLIRGIEKVVILSENRVEVEEGTTYTIEIGDDSMNMVLESAVDVGNHHKYIFAKYEEEVSEDE